MDPIRSNPLAMSDARVTSGDPDASMSSAKRHKFLLLRISFAWGGDDSRPSTTCRFSSSNLRVHFLMAEVLSRDRSCKDCLAIFSRYLAKTEWTPSRKCPGCDKPAARWTKFSGVQAIPYSTFQNCPCPSPSPCKIGACSRLACGGNTVVGGDVEQLGEMTCGCFEVDGKAWIKSWGPTTCRIWSYSRINGLRRLPRTCLPRTA